MTRRRPEVNRPHAHDTMRLYGIQSPDPVALTGFSGIIRPLSIMFYAAIKNMAIKVIALLVEMAKCSATGDRHLVVYCLQLGFWLL